MRRTKLLFNQIKNQKKKNPKLAVSVVPFLKVSQDDYEILLIKRKNEPDKGLWSIPGGSVEYGELTKDAIQRELLEETNIHSNEYELSEIFEISEVIKNRENEISFHYVILQFFAIIKHEPNKIIAGDDAEDYIRVSKKEIKNLTQKMTKNLFGVIEKAHQKIIKQMKQ